MIIIMTSSVSIEDLIKRSPGRELYSRLLKIGEQFIVQESHHREVTIGRPN